MTSGKTGLVVTAHPGDFVWRAGGAIALHARKGYRVVALNRDILRGAIRVVPVDIRAPQRPAGLIMPRHRRRSPGLQALDSALRDYLASVRGTGLFDLPPRLNRAE
jgi:hypothetical protein